MASSTQLPSLRAFTAALKAMESCWCSKARASARLRSRAARHSFSRSLLLDWADAGVHRRMHIAQEDAYCTCQIKKLFHNCYALGCFVDLTTVWTKSLCLFVYSVKLQCAYGFYITACKCVFIFLYECICRIKVVLLLTESDTNA